ncbi:MAG: PKD domain-containing protein [bacterium]|nr:PKD domain-containing protein [bacterium]
MEQLQFSFRQFIYLSGGLFVVVIFLLILKFVFPVATVDILPAESSTKPVVFNWELLRKPISISLPSLDIALSAFPQATTSGAFIDLTAEVKGVSQGPFVYHFDCQSDGVFELETEPVFQKRYTAESLCLFNQEGDFKAKVVVDGFFDYFQNTQEVKEKKTAETQTDIIVQTTNLPPVFSQCDVDNVEGTTQINFNFNFTSQAQDPNGDELTYEWDFGDGNKAEGQNVEYGYKTMGFFIPKVKVTDSKGAFSYCIAKSLTVLKGLSSFEIEKKPEIIGRQDPFSPVKIGELPKTQATTTQATTTTPTPVK